MGAVIRALRSVSFACVRNENHRAVRWATRNGSSMAERSSAPAHDDVAQKWRDLAERRRAHFVALFHSGRWKHYYTEQQFLDRLREAVRTSERWAEIAASAKT